MNGRDLALASMAGLAGLAALVGPRAGSQARAPSIRKTGIAKGTLLYHGTKGSDRFTMLRGPAWVSTSENVARQFIDWHGGRRHAPRILVFRAKTRITGLVRIEDEAEMKRLVNVVDPYEDARGSLRELAELVCAAGYTGWHTPHNYGHFESDTLLCNPSAWLELVEVMDEGDGDDPSEDDEESGEDA